MFPFGVQPFLTALQLMSGVALLLSGLNSSLRPLAEELFYCADARGDVHPHFMRLSGFMLLMLGTLNALTLRGIGGSVVTSDVAFARLPVCVARPFFFFIVASCHTSRVGHYARPTRRPISCSSQDNHCSPRCAC